MVNRSMKIIKTLYILIKCFFLCICMILLSIISTILFFFLILKEEGEYLIDYSIIDIKEIWKKKNN